MKRFLIICAALVLFGCRNTAEPLTGENYRFLALEPLVICYYDSNGNSTKVWQSCSYYVHIYWMEFETGQEINLGETK